MLLRLGGGICYGSVKVQCLALVTGCVVDRSLHRGSKQHRRGISPMSASLEISHKKKEYQIMAKCLGQ
ncbi:hypothetical protein J6590_020120 [Homalodisca vitripennis]|nr:hypothetical protein J6590_020116 [Homalodisca vitripennis]KAG8327418.1 hypothetical protein J6590_020120 [Homalodisca vitripennis]